MALKRKQQFDISESETLPSPKQRARSVKYVTDIKSLLGESISPTSSSYKWDKLLEEIRKHHNNLDDWRAESRVLPGTLFGNPPLSIFLHAIQQPGLKLEIRHHDYDSLFPNKEIYWVADVIKVVGYRLLVRYEGMDRKEDERHDFWISLGSDELKHIGYCKWHENADLLPPKPIRTSQQDWVAYINGKMIGNKTFLEAFEEERRISLVAGRFKVGTRLELLDRQQSDSVRPARVIRQIGRRICVRVSAQDVNTEDLGDDTAQIKTGIWCDESWELIFPVGWGKRNGWKVVANNLYMQHCEQIVSALAKGKQPGYTTFDASPEIFHDRKKDDNEVENMDEWKVGMKFECLDPLNESFLELKVATCVELLHDGYLKVGFDGPDMESEAIPFHRSSPYLFPINYSSKYEIKLVGPSNAMSKFSWKEYLRQCQATAAPDSLFDPVPPQEEMAKYKIGAKLEATDQCESNLVCPATVRAVRGRLLQIHFDGWGKDYDQLFDYRSRDLFPLGWCEIYGYKLEPPKGTMLEKRNK